MKVGWHRLGIQDFKIVQCHDSYSRPRRVLLRELVDEISDNGKVVSRGVNELKDEHHELDIVETKTLGKAFPRSICKDLTRHGPSLARQFFQPQNSCTHFNRQT